MSVDALRQALELSETLLEAAREQDWDRLEPLDARRQPLIREAFAQPEALPLEEALRLKQLNDKIVEELNGGRQQARNQQLRHRKGDQAARAYRSVDTAE